MRGVERVDIFMDGPGRY